VELGELVTVEIEEPMMDPKCPFSHEKPNPHEKNELGGIGSKLGDNMAKAPKAIGVNTSKPPVGADYTAGSTEKDPRDRGAHKITYVFVTVNGERVTLDDGDLPYPLTCAAHHLVPAQESLKEHDVLRFMCKDEEEQDFRSGAKEAKAAVEESMVWGNVAYNVNGCQNGVWLPGNYAVGAGIGGVEVWKSRATKRSTYTDKEAAENWERALDLGAEPWTQLSLDPKEVEGPQPGESLSTALKGAATRDFMLAGENYNIDPGNPKWGYVKAAMDAMGGQFHDRHEPYSDEVKTYLTKIFVAYQKKYDHSTKMEGGCDECKKAARPEGAKEELVGPPYDIVTRLVSAANFFKKFVQTESVTARNIYTSKWVKAWMDKKP
jgi:hypothetical protein